MNDLKKSTYPDRTTSEESPFCRPSGSHHVTKLISYLSSDFIIGWIGFSFIIFMINAVIIIFLEDDLLTWTKIKIPLILSLMIFFNGQVISYTTEKFRYLFDVLPNFMRMGREELEVWYQQKFDGLTNDRMMALFGIAFGLIVQFYIARLGLWYDTVLANAFISFVIFVVCYLTGIGLYMMIYTAFMVIEIGSHELIVPRYQHPEKSVRSIGSLFFLLSVFAIIMYSLYVVWFILSEWKFMFLVQMMFGSWGVIIVAFFIIPQITIHHYMLRTKNEHLDDFLVVLNQALYNSIDEPTAENIHDFEKKLALYKEIVSMNTWPFDTEALYTIIGGIIAPTLMVIHQMFFA